MMRMEQENILEVRGLTKQFGGLTAVNQVDIVVKRGEIHSLVGPNGAGKTTTLSMINGTLPSTSGQVIFDGTDITKEKADRIARMGMGRTFQNIKLFPTLTVLENIMVGGHASHTKGGLIRFLLGYRESDQLEEQLRAQAEEMARFVGVYELRDHLVGNLAYGRQKMTELARSLMLHPKLILLDEPAAGLNPTERSEFVSMLHEIHKNGTDLFLIEHNMDVVMNVSDNITVLNFGRKIAEGTPSEIQNNPEVIKAYLGDGYQAIEKEKK